MHTANGQYHRRKFSFKHFASAWLLLLASAQPASALSPEQIDAWRLDGSLLEIRIAGSEVLTPLLAKYIQSLAAPNTLDILQSSYGRPYQRAYSFQLKDAISTPYGYLYAGMPILILKREDSSLQGSRTLLNGGDPNSWHLFVSKFDCQVADASTFPTYEDEDPFNPKPSYICEKGTHGKTHAVISELEPFVHSAVINGGYNQPTDSLDSAPIAQRIYGVAVNKKLYLALQKAQGLVAANATVIDESAAAQPSIPKSFISGALTGQLLGSSAASKKGWNLLIPATVDSNINNKRINVCRRTPGSGTQAASNLYFANNPCGGNANQYPVTAGTTSATLAVLGSLTTLQNSSTQNVENCLRAVEALADSTGGGYAFGVLGRETTAHATGIDKDYRYVKLSGAAPERAAAIAGDYDFVYSMTMQWPKSAETNAPSSEVLVMLSKIRSEIASASFLSNYISSPHSYFNGFIVPPMNYSGAWTDRSSQWRQVSSRVDRSNSCTPARIFK